MKELIVILGIVGGVALLMWISECIDKFRGNPKVPAFPILFLGLPTLLFGYVWFTQSLKDGFHIKGFLAVFMVPLTIISAWIFVLVLFNLPDLVEVIYKKLRGEKEH